MQRLRNKILMYIEKWKDYVQFTDIALGTEYFFK